MTVSQLRSFAAVARLGSVRAAARELGVTEPSVSLAVGALRRQLGDALWVREGRAVVLTPGGRRLAEIADEIVRLAAQAHRSVGDAEASPSVLRVAVTGTVEEHVVAPLLEAFTDRTPGLQATVEVAAPARFADLLLGRRADITLGPRPSAREAVDLVSVAFLHYRAVVVAGPDHPLAGRADVPPVALAHDRWLVGPAGAEAGTPTGQYFGRARIDPDDVRVFGSEAAALSAAAAGDGVMLAFAPAVADGLRRRAIARLDVRGTPIEDLFYATTLAQPRCVEAALALRRFAITRTATQAMTARRRGVSAARVRPAVHVTLWRSVP